VASVYLAVLPCLGALPAPHHTRGGQAILEVAAVDLQKALANRFHLHLSSDFVLLGKELPSFCIVARPFQQRGKDSGFDPIHRQDEESLAGPSPRPAKSENEQLGPHIPRQPTRHLGSRKNLTAVSIYYEADSVGRFASVAVYDSDLKPSAFCLPPDLAKVHFRTFLRWQMPSQNGLVLPLQGKHLIKQIACVGSCLACGASTASVGRISFVLLLEGEMCVNDLANALTRNPEASADFREGRWPLA